MANFNGALTHIPHQKWDGEYSMTINKAVVYDLMRHKDDYGIKLLAVENKHSFLLITPRRLPSISSRMRFQTTKF